MRVRLSLEEIRNQIGEIGVCMFGQSQNLAPADRRLYQLRDATATVESLPLIVASILSKKLAEDLHALVLDVKVGSGAIFEDHRKTSELGRALVRVARRLGLKCVAVLTAMDQPLGRSIGNALEVRQAIEVLQGDCSAGDYVECLLALGGWMVFLGGKARSPEEGSCRLAELIKNGKAIERFRRMVEAQGGDPRIVDNPGLLSRASGSKMAASQHSGFISSLDARKLGETAVLLGAGRSIMEESLDYGAGILLDKKLGDRVKQGECVARLYGSDPARLEQAHAHFQTAFRVTSQAPHLKPLVRKILK
jgi:pyrimidine-nucleoside phosphorylase